MDIVSEHFNEVAIRANYRGPLFESRSRMFSGIRDLLRETMPDREPPSWAHLEMYKNDKKRIRDIVA